MFTPRMYHIMLWAVPVFRLVAALSKAHMCTRRSMCVCAHVVDMDAYLLAFMGRQAFAGSRLHAYIHGTQPAQGMV